MKKIETRIKQLEQQITESHSNKETKLLITEMKKIGIEKLPYSYSALKVFIDPETMNIHYNKHYKGYIDKLNDALSKKKYGDIELEQIIKTISRFDKTIRNNAGGAFNHALFWKMLSPEPQKLQGELYKKITKQFGSFPNFKKEFETIAKERFGSGWVWLVLTAKNTLKIMSTPNQDNPLMNIIEGGGFPILGLDLWEHAYYLKYQNKRDEYIKNFWKVVNWDFVSKLYEMKTKTKLLESTNMEKLLIGPDNPRFCDERTVSYFRKLMTDSRLKSLYQKGITEILKKVFSQFWVDGTTKEMSGFYGIESPEGRSILNNLNTNINTFCLLVEAVNKEIDKINKPNKKFDFSKESSQSVTEVSRFLSALNHFRNEIFTKENEDFINIIKVLNKLWKRGQKSENSAVEKIEKYFGKDCSIEKIGAHGSKEDAYKGVDLKINLNGEVKTAQVKPYTSLFKKDKQISVNSLGQVQPYKVDWMIFVNYKNNTILIFKNNPVQDRGQYIFNENSLIYEIQ